MVYIKGIAAATIFLGFWLWYVPFRWMGVETRVLPSWWQLLIGCTLLCLGAIVALSCVFRFAQTGRGTPAPIDPPRRLVHRGPYRWVRNPMYLGFASLLLGEAVLFGSLAILVLWAVLMAVLHAFVIWYEEPALERKFGEEYRAYRQHVNRWLPSRPKA
jgi:protein-S-isoprenylcysteine O-methyltransferase Ste14